MRWKRAALCNRIQHVTKVTSTWAKNSATINLTSKRCCNALMLTLDAAQHHPSTLVWGMLLDWLREYRTVWLKGNFLMFNMPQKPTVTQKTLSKASFSGGSPKIQCFFFPDWGEKKTRMRNNKRGWGPSKTLLKLFYSLCTACAHQAPWRGPSRGLWGHPQEGQIPAGSNSS